MAEYEQLAGKLIEAIRQQRPFAFGGFLRHLRRIHGAQKRMYSCSVGRTMVTVDPAGDVYPCHRFVGMEAFKMGNIFTGFDADASRQRFLEASVLSLQDCQDCWARYLCSGHCLNEFAKADGSFDSPDRLHCRLARREIELSLFIYAKIREEFPEMLKWLAEPAPTAPRT